MFFVCVLKIMSIFALSKSNIMRDLHDPNNPENLEEENGLTFNEVIKELPENYQELIEDEISIIQIEANTSRKRIANIRAEIRYLIDIYEQTEQTLLVNNLKKLLEL